MFCCAAKFRLDSACCVFVTGSAESADKPVLALNLAALRNLCGWPGACTVPQIPHMRF